MIGIDLLQMPVSRNGYKYLFVAVDLLSRYAKATPVKDKTAKTISYVFRRDILDDDLLGAPDCVLSDNGLEFCNNSFDGLLVTHGIDHRTTTPYNPKGNGTTERLNRTLLMLLRGTTHENLDWADAIPYVLRIYNHSRHEGLGMPRSRL